MDQNRFRPSLAPVQVPQASSTMNARSFKRLRGTARSYFKVNSPYRVENEKPYSTSFRAELPDLFSFQGRQGGSPLPQLKWANREEVWNSMCWKERLYVRDPNLFLHHPEVTPKMRAVLFEWISEVCEVYKLHRETYYLCMDFVDRYLSNVHNFPKNSLQLIGVTALFIAAKLEEIYPPPVKEFAFVTDGACTVEQILEVELIMLKTLKWALTPVTTNHWLLVYLQVVASETNGKLVQNGIYERRCRDFLIPQFQRIHFIRLTQLTDLCSMDEGALHFSYSVIAASAFYHLLQPDQWAMLASGYSWSDLAACIAWMAPFVRVVKEHDVSVKIFPDIRQDDMHNIQSHFIGFRLWEKAHAIATETAQALASPLGHYGGQFSIFPTPPASAERPANVSYAGRVTFSFGGVIGQPKPNL